MQTPEQMLKSTAGLDKTYHSLDRNGTVSPKPASFGPAARFGQDCQGTPDA